jgi:lysophospholipase L1-like esterase
MEDYLNLTTYSNDNALIRKQGNTKVVFMGNSITKNWANLDPDFFVSNGYINRGIGGQTSSQMLLRFYRDVVELKPKVVVINAGTNDIARGDGFYDPVFTLDNIKAMAEMAVANDIRVVLTSVLPAKEYKTSRFNTVENVGTDIDNLNKEIKEYAKGRHIYFVDYYNMMNDRQNHLRSDLTFDGVHPTVEGYKIMEDLIKPIIDSILVE